MLREVEWSTLFFFVGLFMLVEAVVHVGIVGGLADDDRATRPAAITRRGGHGAAVVLGGIASAIVDNIPYTATAIPVVQQLGRRRACAADALWWSLALGPASAAT